MEGYSVIRAYATFVNKNDNTYRTATQIKWGTNEESLGAVLMFNPGSAEMLEKSKEFQSREGEIYNGEINLDPTMKQLVEIIKDTYDSEEEIQGVLTIYNLFPLRNPNMNSVIGALENHDRELLEKNIPSINELKQHPWIIVAWGCGHRRSIIKEEIKKYIIFIINKVECLFKAFFLYSATLEIRTTPPIQKRIGVLDIINL